MEFVFVEGDEQGSPRFFVPALALERCEVLREEHGDNVDIIPNGNGWEILCMGRETVADVREFLASTC
ncbi:hypothetical protein [Paraburkholderia aromaticivorans]|nr:hypothetical protein [Paraburkholderia aromaticivorans]